MIGREQVRVGETCYLCYASVRGQETLSAQSLLTAVDTSSPPNYH